jgi:membrane protein YqaA with SNARE-associated domain
MEELLTGHGYPALFLLSFLASTLLPLGSEWLLVALLLKGFDPTLSVALATMGNTLGALTTYGIGFWGGPVLIGRVLRIDEAARLRSERFYARYGVWSLLLSWLPVVGDPLCLVGGLLRVGFGRFFLLVATGKLARYVVVALLTFEGSRILA